MGSARSTQQFLEVIYLSTDTSVSVTDNLTFSDTLLRELIAIPDLLDLSETAAVELVISPSAIDLLGYDDWITLTIIQVTGTAVGDGISWNETVLHNRVRPEKAASDYLDLQDTVTDHRDVGEIFNISDEATYFFFFHVGDAVDSFGISDDATLTIVNQYVAADDLDFSEAALSSTVVREVSVSDTLTFLEAPFFVTLEEEFVTLQAPYSAIATSVALPNPLFQDGENLVDDLDIKFAEDGTLYTYVRRVNARRLDYTFRMTRSKSIELQNFVSEYNADEMKLTNFKGEVWRVKLVTNPTQFVHIARGTPCGPTVDVSLTFEGQKIN